MKDLFQNYHKHKVLSNIGLLAISAVLAVSVNMFMLSGSTGATLKANVLEASGQAAAWVDFMAHHTPKAIRFTNSQQMLAVKELSFSLAYNHELLSLGEYNSSLAGAQVSVIENNDGFSSYLMSFASPINIPAESTIIDLSYTKSSDETVHFNIINVNFKDTQDESYLLSTQSIIF